MVLDAGRAGQTWRTQRWESFRLNTPGWTTRLLGEQPRDAYLSGGEVVERLAELAVTVPIREGVRVTGLSPTSTGFTLRTSDGEVRARTVVVATGDENIARLPELADALPGRVTQLHSADYRTPAALPEGVVLVVGSGQSGAQISQDLLVGGRQVLIATSPVGRVPVRHRGHDTIDLLHASGFFDHTPADLTDPATMRAHQPILAPGGRALSLQSLARAGATLTGRLVAVDDRQAHFDDSAPLNVAAGDAFATRIRTMLDEMIARTGLPAPPAEPGDLDQPVELDPPTTLQLSEVGAVLWCTGFTGDYLLARPRPARNHRPTAAHRVRGRPARPLVRRAALADPPRLGNPGRHPERRRNRRRRAQRAPARGTHAHHQWISDERTASRVMPELPARRPRTTTTAAGPGRR